MTKTIQIEPDEIAVIANRLVRRLMADQYLDPKYWVPAVESLEDELHNDGPDSQNTGQPPK